MKSTGTFRFLFTLAAAGVVLAAAGDAAAIPAFARKYRISCTTCHAPAPRLKAFGEEFAGRGFRMEEAQEPGYYRAAWNGRDAGGRRVASGVYLVRMAAGGFSSVDKVLLLK